MGNPYDEQLLLDYIEGDLTPAARAEVEQLARKDPRLGQLLSRLTEDRQALRDLPDPAAPDWLMDEVDRQLERVMLMDSWPSEAKAVVRQRFMMRRLVMVAAVAASLAVVATVVISSMTLTGGVPSSGPVVVGKPDTTNSVTTEVAAADPKKTGQPKRFPNPIVEGTPGVVPYTDPRIDPEASPVVSVIPPAPLISVPSIDESPVVVDANKVASVEPGAADIHARAPLNPAQVLKPFDPFASKSSPKSLLEEQRETAKMLVMLPARPDLAPRLELHIVTRDVAVTRKLLESLSAPGGAAVPAETSSSTAPPDRNATQQFTWRIVPTQLLKLMQSVENAPMHTSLQWRQRNPILVVAPTVLAKPVPAAAPTPWPAIDPDYSAVLQQQIPAPEKPPGSDPVASNAVDLAVVIEPVGAAKKDAQSK